MHAVRASAFVTILGLVLGYVFWGRSLRTGAALAPLLCRRSGRLFLCALLAALPSLVERALTSRRSVSPWVFVSCTVLVFYAFAVLGDRHVRFLYIHRFLFWTDSRSSWRSGRRAWS